MTCYIKLETYNDQCTLGNKKQLLEYDYIECI